jgi:hypothetical protein
VIRAELSRAADLAEHASSNRASWDAFFDPYVPAQGGVAELGIAIRAASPASLARSVGWLDGAILGTLLELEAAGVPGIRPDPRPRQDPGEALPHVRFGVVLGPAPHAGTALTAAAAGIERAFSAWSARPPDAELTVTWPAPGSAPTS